MKKLFTLLCVILGTICYSQETFQFTSDGIKQFSAGVYDENEKLVRTLFSGKVFPAGKINYNWDGNGDFGKIVPKGKYSVQLLSHNLKADWEGVALNTSSQFSNKSWGGSKKHNGYYGAAIDIYEHTNRWVYYCTGMSENNITLRKFHLDSTDVAVYLKKNSSTYYSEQRGEKLGGLGSTYHIASDGKYLYVPSITWQSATNNVQNNFVFIMKFDLSTDELAPFTVAGKSISPGNYNYPSVIVLNSGLERFAAWQYNFSGVGVDDKYLYTAQQEQNTVRVFDKVTGEAISTTTALATPRRMVSDGKFLWMIYDKNTIGKFSVSEGVINKDPVLTLSGVSDPHALSVQTVGGVQYVYVTDGDATQQVIKRFRTDNGALDIRFNTIGYFGQYGGYSNNSIVTDDRFYFTKSHGKLAGLNVKSDGTIWICDNGNNRLLRFNSFFKVTHRLEWQGATYSLFMPQGDSSRIIVDFREYEVDYTSPLLTAWKLKRQFEPSRPVEVEGGVTWMYWAAKLRNGRTYIASRQQTDNRLAIMELTDYGLRVVERLSSARTFKTKILPDGSLIETNNGSEIIIKRYALNGFTNVVWNGITYQNPNWSSTGAVVGYISPTASGDVRGGFGGLNNNQIVLFDVDKRTGFHIGAIPFGSASPVSWAWQSAPTINSPRGNSYPSEGQFEIGNNVNYPASGAVSIGDFTHWQYNGENWNGGQTNMHHLLYKNGLQLMQFGVAIANSTAVLPKGYPEMGGNTKTIASTKIGNSLYIWQGEEGYHCGVMRWKVSGLNTIEKITIPLGGEQKTELKASFSAADTVGCLSLTAKFSDRSTAGTESITGWLWNFGDGSTSTLQHPTYSYKKSGTYTVSLKITTQSGATATISKSNYIHVTEGIQLDIQGQTAVCMGEAIALKGVVNSSNTTGYTWRWDFGNGIIDTEQNPSAKYFTKPGNYPVTLTVSNNAGCSGRADAILTVRTAPTVSAGPDAEISLGSSVQLTASGAEKYTWEPAEGLSCTNCPDPVAAPTVTTQYKVTGYDSYGCSASDAVVVNVISKHSAIKIDAKKDICAGETVEIRASGADQFFWSSTGSLPKSTGSVISVTPLVSTLYKVVAKDNSDSITDTASVYITVHAAPKVNAGPDAEICPGTSYQLNATGAATYQWDTDASLSCTDCKEPVAAPIATKQYKVTGFDNFGCSATDLVTINVSAQKKLVIAAKQAICEGEIVTLSASGATTYTWLPSAAVSNPTAAITTAKPLVSTTFSVVAKDNAGCSTDTASVLVTVHAAPQINAGADMTICKGTVQRLQASGAANYTWRTSPALSCTNCESPMAAPTSTTEFVVTGFDTYGCSASDAVVVTVRQPIQVTIDPIGDLCIGKTVTLSAVGADSYSWAPSVGMTNPSAAVTTVSPKASTQYTVIGKDAAGCFADTAKVQVNVWPVPTVEAGEAQTLSAGNTLKLRPKYSKDVTSYLWSNSQTLSCSTCPFPDAKPKNETTYQVEVANAAGCKAQDEVTVRVICNNGNLFIPNTFSPNQDGRNDYFYPRGSGIGRIKSLKIYTRSGDLIFSNENFQANEPSAGWDGRYKGQPLPADVFVYTCEVVCSNNEVLTFKGDVTLLR